MPTLLVGTDFSTRSDRALRRSVLIARQTGWDVLIVAVVDDDKPRRLIDAEVHEARAVLSELEQTLAEVDGVACRTELRIGDPFIALPEAAAAAGATMMVMGPHRRQLLKDQFRGTTVERALRRATVPVIVANGVPSGPYRHVLVTTDLEPYSTASAQLEASLPFLGDARRTLLFVYDPAASALLARGLAPTDERSAYEQEAAAAARSDLRAFMEQADFTGAQPMVRRLGGTVAGEICDVAKEESADLVVLTISDKSALAKAILGSTVENVLRDSACDVLVLRRQKQP